MRLSEEDPWLIKSNCTHGDCEIVLHSPNYQSKNVFEYKVKFLKTHKFCGFLFPAKGYGKITKLQQVGPTKNVSSDELLWIW